MTDPERTAPDGSPPDADSPDDNRPDDCRPGIWPPEDGDLDPDLDKDLDEVLDAELAGSLRALLAPPVGIEDLVADTVTHRLRGSSTLGAAVDLLGLGARTLGLILSEGPGGADRSRDASTTSGASSPPDAPTDMEDRP